MSCHVHTAIYSRPHLTFTVPKDWWCHVCGSHAIKRKPSHRPDFNADCSSFVDYSYTHETLQWRHNGRYGVSNHQPHDCLLNRLFRRRSKKTSKPRITGLCAGNSPWTGEFPAQMASNAENVSIGWRHNEVGGCHSWVKVKVIAPPCDDNEYWK